MPCRESVGAWKNIGPSPWTRVSAYTSEIYFLIRGCALERRRWVDGFNRKTGCHSYSSEFYECLEPSYESQSPASSCLLPLHPPIPALENRFRKHRLVPDLADLFLLQLEKFRWMENTHGLVSNQCRLVAIYKLFISSDVWLRVNRMDEDFIARLIGIWMAEWVKMVDRFLRVV